MSTKKVEVTCQRVIDRARSSVGTKTLDNDIGQLLVEGKKCAKSRGKVYETQNQVILGFSDLSDESDYLVPLWDKFELFKKPHRSLSSCFRGIMKVLRTFLT